MLLCSSIGVNETSFDDKLEVAAADASSQVDDGK